MPPNSVSGKRRYNLQYLATRQSRNLALSVGRDLGRPIQCGRWDIADKNVFGTASYCSAQRQIRLKVVPVKSCFWFSFNPREYRNLYFVWLAMYRVALIVLNRPVVLICTKAQGSHTGCQRTLTGLNKK